MTVEEDIQNALDLLHTVARDPLTDQHQLRLDILDLLQTSMTTTEATDFENLSRGKR